MQRFSVFNRSQTDFVLEIFVVLFSTLGTKWMARAERANYDANQLDCVFLFFFYHNKKSTRLQSIEQKKKWERLG